MVPTMPSAVIGSARPASCRRASSNEQENMYPATMATISSLAFHSGDLVSTRAVSRLAHHA